MYGRSKATFAAALTLGALAFAAFAPASPAATREPLRDALAAATRPARALDSAARPRPAALRTMVRQAAQRHTAGDDELEISSDSYDAAAIESVAATLRSLDHGPELALLSVYVATREEIREACGAAVVACYIPSEWEMVVSGVDRPVAGVPRDFAIAHEYGHHIANSRASAARSDGASASLSSLEGGTLRWATYERVCQLTRRGRLFPGDQGAHYWDNPEEAFAQSYADLNRPGAGVSWQYTPLLRPTTASLVKIHTDVSRPWNGPVESSWSGAVAAPSAPQATGTRAGALGIDPGRALGDPPWRDSRLVRTPLDGRVSVSVQATPGAPLRLVLRDPTTGRPVARALTDSSGAADLSYANCGHPALRLDVRATTATATFQATITRP